MRIRFKHLVQKLATSLIAVVLTLLVLEGVFRLMDIRARYHTPRTDMAFGRGERPRVRPKYGLIPHVTVRSQYDSDPRGYFDPGNIIDHVHNSVGWRDVEHTLEKPQGTFRIMGLGDSYLWGQGVRREDVCLTKLGKLIADLVPDRNVETINTGLSAANTAFERDLLFNVGVEYEPDLVILHFVPNDVEWNTRVQGPKIEFFEEYTAIYEVPDFFSEYSYLWGWARQRYLRYVRAATYIQECLARFRQDSDGWRDCRRAIDDIQAFCRSRKIGFLVVIFPFFVELDGDYPFQVIHNIVREHCGSRQIPVLDLCDHYRDFNGPELWVHPTDQHPNEAGHKIAAQAVAEYLRDHPELLGLTKKRPPEEGLADCKEMGPKR